MSTPVNLNKRRKEKARAAKRSRADENAVKFGRTKAEREQSEQATASLHRFVDLHKREE